MRYLLALTIVAGLASIGLAQDRADAILGEWLSANKDSRVLIYRQADKYYGKITWGTGAATKDEKNPDPTLRRRDLIGLVILRDFEYAGGNTWADGSIYDPREGKPTPAK